MKKYIRQLYNNYLLLTIESAVLFEGGGLLVTKRYSEDMGVANMTASGSCMKAIMERLRWS